LPPKGRSRRTAGLEKEGRRRALKRVKDGEDFGEIAKRLSDGRHKDQGGYIANVQARRTCQAARGNRFQMKPQTN